MTSSSAAKACAAAYAELFPAVYLRFHRRDGKRRELSPAARGILLHLSAAGPLTVGECALHLERAQSVVSEIVNQLERHDLLARVRDERDRRRTLVWLTAEGRARLIEEQEVLARDTLERAFERMTTRERDQLVRGTRALLRAAERRRQTKERRR